MYGPIHYSKGSRARRARPIRSWFFASIGVALTLAAASDAWAGPAHRARITRANVAAALAARSAPNFTCHILPPSTGVPADNGLPACQMPGVVPGLQPMVMNPPSTSEADAVTGAPWSPTDMTYQGGPTVQSAQFFDFYLNCPTNDQTCWGNPEQFQTDLFADSFPGFIHITDQYTGSSGENRYALGPAFADFGSLISSGLCPVHNGINTCGLTATQAAVHAVLVAAFPGGGGYSNVYNLFFSQGLDVCMEDTFQNCYSPGGNHRFVFCAYHGSFDTTDATGAPVHAVFNVEPFQDVPGCQNNFIVNSSLIDSTNSTLEHEVFELISDPDLNAWWDNLAAVIPGSGVVRALQGNEIGDICVQNFFGLVLNGNLYSSQLEYSTLSHACSAGP